jgi:hypothetical protein
VIVFVAEEEEAAAASPEVVGEGAIVSTKEGNGWPSFEGGKLGLGVGGGTASPHSNGSVGHGPYYFLVGYYCQGINLSTAFLLATASKTHATARPTLRLNV